MVLRTHVLQMIVFMMPARGLIQKQPFLIWFGEHMFPNDSFYNASAGSLSKTIVSNMAWRPHVLQMIFFIMPARGLIQMEQ